MKDKILFHTRDKRAKRLSVKTCNISQGGSTEGKPYNHDKQFVVNINRTTEAFLNLGPSLITS